MNNHNFLLLLHFSQLHLRQNSAIKDIVIIIIISGRVCRCRSWQLLKKFPLYLYIYKKYIYKILKIYVPPSQNLSHPNHLQSQEGCRWMGADPRNGIAGAGPSGSRPFAYFKDFIIFKSKKDAPFSFPSLSWSRSRESFQFDFWANF